MTREPPCGRPEAQARTRLGRAYLDQAMMAAAEEGEAARSVAAEEGEAARSVAAGNAVLAAIAAADALCCLHLGRRHRGPDHRAAAELLRAVRPDGRSLAAALERALALKDAAHYGDRFVGAAELKAALRAAGVLVGAAEESLTSM